jgi:hypothetical protein
MLFPYQRDFRLRFESEWVATSSDLVGGEWVQKGLAGVARLWRSALADVRNMRIASSNLGAPITYFFIINRLSLTPPRGRQGNTDRARFLQT